MNNINPILYFFYWQVAEGFGFNTNLLETNIINLTVVIGILIYFGKGVLTSLLENRKNAILITIRDAQKRYQEATEQLNQAKLRLEVAKKKAEEIRSSGLSQIQIEKNKLIESASEDFKRLNESKNNTIKSEEQKALQEVKQQISKLAFKKALEVLNTSLNIDLHTRMIDYHIGLLKNM